MDFNALLEARRSVRAFDDTKAVTKEQIKTLYRSRYSGSFLEKFANCQILLFTEW